MAGTQGRTSAPPHVLWHCYPLGALGRDLSGADRSPAPLSCVADWLPHVRSLGADTLLLGPVLGSLSHGYDTVDHRILDDRLGGGTDLTGLVRAAAAHDVGIVLDVPFAYLSRSFFRIAEERGGATDDPWLLRSDDGGLVPWRVDSLVTPDHGSAGFRAYVVDVLCRWLDQGVVGFRLDSAWSVPDPFWRQVLAAARQEHPDAWFLGQVFDDDLAPVVDSAGYSTATAYGMMHALRSWLCGGPGADLVATLHTSLARPGAHTFLGNHDVARLADVVDRERLPLAWAALFGLPGNPAIYYGDEVGTTSAWTATGDDALLRPTWPVPEAATPAGEALLATVRALGVFRRGHAWMRAARIDSPAVEDDVVRWTVTDGDHALDVVLNRSPRPVAVLGRTRDDLLLGEVLDADPLRVAPLGWAVLAHRRP